MGPSIRIARDTFDEHFEKHRVSARSLLRQYPTGQLFAWPLSDVRRLTPGIAYQHPGGGSWVKLTPQNVEEWERLQACA